jgi:hypothetical protein
VGASVVSGGDASPVLDATEDILDFVALPVEQLVIVVLDLAVRLWRDTRRDALGDQSIPEPVAVIAFITQQHLGAWQAGKQQNSTGMIAHLTFGKEQDDRSPRAITNGMKVELRSPTAPSSSRLWCARYVWVEPPF